MRLWRRWKATAGNIAEDMFGREVLAFPLYYKASGLNKYGCCIATCKEVMSLDGMSNNDVDFYDLYKDKTKQEAASVICIDDVGKTSYVTYDGNNTEVYFSDVEVLAIMQAPPVYEEINDDSYIGNSGTSFSKSVGSSSSETQSNSLTAGIITGYEEEFSILGMKQVGGIDIEVKLAATSTYANTKEVSYDAMKEAISPPEEYPKIETLSLITSSINLIMSFPISIKLYFSLLKELFPCP